MADLDLAPTSDTTGTPGWLLQGEVAMCPCGCIGKRKKGSFVEKTLDGGAGLMRQVMFGDDVAAREGFLQRFDPRAKLLALVVLLLAASLVRHVPVLIAMYVGTLVLAAVSALPVGFFIKRVWLFIPVFTLVVVLPATLSVITPGDVVVPLWSWHGETQGLTAQGLMSAALITCRVAVSISLVVLLTLTTPWVKLLAALRSLGVPRVFILVIGMAYRYIFLLLGSVTDMYEARKARTVGAVAHDKAARAFVSASAGALFSKSSQLSEEVHQAMVSRGYTGANRALTHARVRTFDICWAVACVSCALAALGVDRAFGR